MSFSGASTKAAAWNYASISLVFFDLETSGLSPSCDLLQISAKCGDAVFNRYVQPSKPIEPKATEKNGLTNVNGSLHLHGRPVATSSLQEVLQAMLDFLQSLGKPCLLVAHNCYGFDAPRIVRAIQICRLEIAFQNVVAAFVDSLLLFSARFPERTVPGKLTLTTLASELLGLDTSAAHDALADTQLLERLVCQYFSYNDIANAARYYVDFLR